MKKKGFTLVEIIISIGLIILIGISSIFSFNLVKNNKEEQEFLSDLEIKCKVYLEKLKLDSTITQLRNADDYLFIKVSDLITEGIVKEEDIDAIYNTTMKESSENYIKIYVNSDYEIKIEYPAEYIENYIMVFSETECEENSTEKIYEKLSDLASNPYDLMDLLINYNIQDHSRCYQYIPSSDSFLLYAGEREMRTDEYDLIINPPENITKGSERYLHYDVQATIKSNGTILEKSFDIPIKDKSGPILLNFYGDLKFFTGYDGPLIQYESNINFGNDYYNYNVEQFNLESFTFDNVDGFEKYDIQPILNDIPSKLGAFGIYYSGGKTFNVIDDAGNPSEYHFEVTYNNLDFPYDITNISEKYNNGVFGNDLSIYKILKDGKLKYNSSAKNLNDVISNLNSSYGEKIGINAYECGDDCSRILNCSIDNISDFNSGDCIKELQLSLIGDGYLRFDLVISNSYDFRTLYTDINIENKFSSIIVSDYIVSSLDDYVSYYGGLPFLDVLNRILWVHDLAPYDYYSTRDLLKMGGYTIELSTNYYGWHDVWKFENINDLNDINSYSRPTLIDDPLPAIDKKIWGTIPITVKISKGAFSQTLETEFDIIKDFGLYCMDVYNNYYPINSCECNPGSCYGSTNPPEENNQTCADYDASIGANGMYCRPPECHYYNPNIQGPACSWEM